MDKMGVTKEEVKERIADTNGFLKGLFLFGIISKSSPVFGLEQKEDFIKDIVGDDLPYVK